MSSLINTVKSHPFSLDLVDADGSLQKELAALKVKPLLTVEDVRAVAEAEFIKLHEQNKKDSEKKAYENAQYGEEIYFLFVLDDCRLFLTYLKIREQKIEEYIEREAKLNRAESEKLLGSLQDRFEGIYKAQLKPEPLNQEKEKLFAKASSILIEFDKRIDQISARMEKNWGAKTWEEGIKAKASEAIVEMKKVDPFEGFLMSPDKKADADTKTRIMYDDLEEKLSHRASITDLRKMLDSSYKARTLFTPTLPTIAEEESVAVPMAPTLDKVYAPSNKHIRTQYEVDTEVMFASNARNLYKDVFDSIVQEKSFTRMGVDLAKKLYEKIKPGYIDKIHDQMDDAILRDNLLQMKQHVRHLIREMKLDIRATAKEAPALKK